MKKCIVFGFIAVFAVMCVGCGTDRENVSAESKNMQGIQTVEEVQDDQGVQEDTTNEEYSDFEDILYHAIGAVKTTEGAEEISPTTNDYLVEIRQEVYDDGASATEELHVYSFNEEGDVVSHDSRTTAIYQNGAEIDASYTKDAPSFHESKYDFAVDNVLSEDWDYCFFSEALTPKQVESKIQSKYAGATLISETYAQPSSENFMVLQGTDNYAKRYLNGELVSGLGVEMTSEDHFESEMHYYTRSQTYSFNEAGHVIDLDTVLIFDSAANASYFQDNLWNVDTGECIGYEEYTSEGSELFVKENHKWDGVVEADMKENADKISMISDTGCYLSKTTVSESECEEIWQNCLKLDKVYVWPNAEVNTKLQDMNVNTDAKDKLTDSGQTEEPDHDTQGGVSNSETSQLIVSLYGDSNADFTITNTNSGSPGTMRMWQISFGEYLVSLQEFQNGKFQCDIYENGSEDPLISNVSYYFADNVLTFNVDMSSISGFSFNSIDTYSIYISEGGEIGNEDTFSADEVVL